MLSRRICNTSFMAYKTANLIQRHGQIRLFNASSIVLREQNPADQNKKAHNEPIQGKSNNNMMILAALGAAAAAGGAYMLFKSKGVGEAVEGAKDKVAGQYIASKANKEFEHAKEVIVAVAKEIGGKDLADKVSKIIDEAKDMVQKMAGDMNVKENAGKAYRQGKEAVQQGKEMVQNISEGGIAKYAGEFQNVQKYIVEEAKKIGGDDLAKKATKVFDESKDKIEKMVKNISKNGIDAKEFESIQEYIIKQTKSIGGDDLGKKATKIFGDAKEKLQSLASDLGEHGINDKEFQKVKEFVVKEAEKIGGRDLAKKAAKLMDEAKETIEKVASEFSKHGPGKALQSAKDEVQKKIK